MGSEPERVFKGRKLDGKRDFRCSFCDYVQCTVPNTDVTLKPRTEDCVVMLPLGNRTGTVRMLSLATEKLVNRDQFIILPMPESFIKRLNELALADGRIKGKGELEKRTVSFEVDGEMRNGLPETMQTEVNNGVDPSVSLMDASHDQELIYVDADQETNNTHDAHQEEPYTEESYYADDMIPTPRVQIEPRVVDMDELLSSFRQPGVKNPDAAQVEYGDEQGVPKDYGENGAIDTGVMEEATEVADRYSSVGHLVVPRQKLMNMFRGDRHGSALLTRNYNSVGGDWNISVLNISLNEALRTRQRKPRA